MDSNLTQSQLSCLKEDFQKFIGLYNRLSRARNNKQREEITKEMDEVKAEVISNYKLGRFDIHLSHYGYDNDYFKNDVSRIITEQEEFNETFRILQIDELNWTGYLGATAMCNFQFFKDKEGTYWINNIGCSEHQKGYGTAIIKEALKIYQEIHVSTADESEVKARRNKEDKDYRYVKEFNYESSTLKKFVDSLILEGILKPEWIRNPFGD